MEKTRKHLQDGLLCDNLLYKETVWGGNLKQRCQSLHFMAAVGLDLGNRERSCSHEKLWQKYSFVQTTDCGWEQLRAQWNRSVTVWTLFPRFPDIFCVRCRRGGTLRQTARGQRLVCCDRFLSRIFRERRNSSVCRFQIPVSGVS